MLALNNKPKRHILGAIAAAAMLGAAFPGLCATATLYSSNKLTGTSNAVLCNGDIYVALTEEGGTWSGYPDGNRPGNMLKLLIGNKATNVDTSGMADVAAASSIACDSLNQVHLAWQKWAGFSYAFDSPYQVFNGKTAAESSMIFEDANWGWFTTLGVDSQNKAHVIQFGHAGYFLNYSTNESGEWVNDDISGMGIYYADPTLAVDSADQSHVMAFSTTGTPNLLLHWAQDESGNWSKENVAKDAAGLGNIVFDPRDKSTIYAVYYTTNKTVNLLKKSNGTWSSKQVGKTTIPNVGHMLSMALSPDGKPYIALLADNKDVRLYTTDKSSGDWVYYALGKFVQPTTVSRVEGKAPTVLFGSGGPIVIYNAGDKIVKATLKGVTPVR